MTSQTPSLVVVLGETASGKSRLALDLARRFNGEIICADAWTVRRGLDIGTAKPSAEERGEAPHHLLDVVGPCDDFTAAVFKRMAIEKVAEIASRGKLPILAGGTGLYIDGVIFDYSFLPAPGSDVREQLNSMTIQQLLLMIQQHNYSLENIDVRNKRRLIRLLETAGAKPQRQPLRPNTLLIGISVSPGVLRQRITARVDSMLKLGLEKEVERLSRSYGWECEGMKGIGYQEWKEYFEGHQTLQETRDRIVSDTQGLAKRQRTWFKRNKRIHWILRKEEAVDLVTTFLNK